MFCGEISKFIPNVLKFSCSRIDNLHITGKILLSVHLTKTIEGLICNIGDVKFMVA